MRRLALALFAVALFAVALFGAGVLAGQATHNPAQAPPFYYSERFETAFSHRLSVYHWKADYDDPKRKGACEITLWRRGGSENLAQVIDVRFCQWLQQK